MSKQDDSKSKKSGGIFGGGNDTAHHSMRGLDRLNPGLLNIPSKSEDEEETDKDHGKDRKDK